ncbi:MAG TPA: EamA family transporter [Candidatus Methylomirabilis sp.]|nr:EamA family transporter [Candidatus Methylomirabilis sp.]
MWLLPLALVLCSAGLHASWNLIVKSEVDKLFSGWLTVLTPSLILSPALFVTGLPPREAWPFLLGSGALESLYVVALTRAYTYGDLSVVYPVARGLAPVFVAMAAPIALGERLSPLAMLAILLVGGGISWLGFSAGRSATRVAALLWAVTTAALIASYSIVDKAGVSRSHPLAYIITLFGLTAVIMTPYVLQQREFQQLRAIWRLRWRILVAGGLLSFGAYLLVLIAMRLTQVSYIAALRESSVIIATLLGWRVLKEGFGGRRLAASTLVTLGLFLLVLAMRG